MNVFARKARSLFRMVGMHGPGAVFRYHIAGVISRNWMPKYLVCANVQGSRMLLDARDPGISRALFTQGIREVPHLHQIWANITHDMTGIDLGANIGYYALIESQIVGPGGRIFCIEPESENVELLRRNIEINGRKEICLVRQLAVGDRDGTAEFRLSAFSNRHGMSSKHYYGTKDGAANQVIPVPMLTLDSFMESEGLAPDDIDFLRMDIEGYEVMAFQGMEKLLNADTPLKVFIELHPKYYGEWGWTFERFLDFLESKGLKVIHLAYYRNKRIPIMLANPSREQILRSVEDGGNATGGSHAVLERA